jgi:hypothetical protein
LTWGCTAHSVRAADQSQTAKALGLTIREAFLLRVDEIIE